MAADQLYCLECGERRAQMSSVLRAGPPAATAATPAKPPSQPPAAPGGAATQNTPQRNNTVTVLAGVGVLLLAMGVGVLIGRAGSSKQSAAPAQVISVAPAAGGGASSTPAEAAASFTDDWPSGTSGYTVQLQTLPTSGTAVSAVAAAKAAARAKGARAVGALKSDDFSSLPAGNYVIYSGVYHTKAEASKALSGLKKSFPGASVVHVSSGSSASSEESGSSSGSSASPNLNHPAPPSVIKTLRQGGGGSGGQSYEQKSKNLPNVVETG